MTEVWRHARWLSPPSGWRIKSVASVPSNDSSETGRALEGRPYLPRQRHARPPPARDDVIEQPAAHGLRSGADYLAGPDVLGARSGVAPRVRMRQGQGPALVAEHCRDDVARLEQAPPVGSHRETLDLEEPSRRAEHDREGFLTPGHRDLSLDERGHVGRVPDTAREVFAASGSPPELEGRHQRRRLGAAQCRRARNCFYRHPCELPEAAVLREQALARRDPRISDSIFGFHAQKASEKYLKAILALREESPARTHDLVVLANQCQASGHPLPEELSNISKLSPFAVQERYPLAMTPAIDRRGVLALVAEARRWTEDIVG